MWCKEVVMMMFLSLLKVSSETPDLISERIFQRANGTVNIHLDYAEVISGARSKLECTSMCDRKSWCNAITWDPDNKTCQGFTRTLDQQSIPPHVSHVYTSRKDVCVGEGYVNGSGMCIKYFPGQNLTWYQAVDHCIAERGRLVVLNTMDKYNFIVDKMKTDPILAAISTQWVGAQKIGGIWTWSTGEVLLKDIPVLNNQPDFAFCLGFYQGGLDDYDCHWKPIPLCEK